MNCVVFFLTSLTELNLMSGGDLVLGIAWDVGGMCGNGKCQMCGG
jgi:hypothetical protein